jgi:hypothetical protein
MRRLLLLAALAVALTASRPAPAAAESGAGAGGWYGWQLLLADAAAAGLVAAPVDLSWKGATVGVGLTALFANGSIVHMANGNSEAAVWSLLRLPAFLAGRFAGLGIAALSCQSERCDDLAPSIGAYVGLGVVVLVDLLSASTPRPYYLAPEAAAALAPPRPTIPAPRRALAGGPAHAALPLPLVLPVVRQAF